MAKHDLLSSSFHISICLLIYDLIYLDTFDNSSLLYKCRCPFWKGTVSKKMAFRSVLLCSFVTFLSSGAFGFQDGEPMRFESPKMNEEEQHSPHTPKSFEMTCDACSAIAYQVIVLVLTFLFLTCEKFSSGHFLHFVVLLIFFLFSTNAR